MSFIYKLTKLMKILVGFTFSVNKNGRNSYLDMLHDISHLINLSVDLYIFPTKSYTNFSMNESNATRINQQIS